LGLTFYPGRDFVVAGVLGDVKVSVIDSNRPVEAVYAAILRYRRLLRPNERTDEFAFDLGRNCIRVNALRAQKLSSIFHFVNSRGLNRYVFKSG
jgi:hypothetical protein